MVHLIDKAALVAEIDRRIADNKKDIERASHKNLEDYFEGYEDALALLKQQFLDTIEVKEVDLEKELDSMITPELKLHKALPSLFDVAKHFFQLGLQANNTLTWEDIEIIGKLRLNVALEYRKKELCSKSKFPKEDYCKEVLKRFNAHKGE